MSSFGFCKNVLSAIEAAGYEAARPIQAEVIPKVMKGRDVLGLAQTGTGKTAAFVLPMIEKLLAGSGGTPRGLILAPTRELATQISKEIDKLGRFTSVRSTTLYGGVSAAPQIRSMKELPDIVVACPGRLLDLEGSGHVRIDGVSMLVLDEADQMLDMGFLPDIERILARLPPQRQNLLFSATMPGPIRELVGTLLKNPHVVELEHAAPLETIEHALYPVEARNKTDLLRHLMSAKGFRSAIVFLRTKERAEQVANDLGRSGHSAVGLHGNMTQSQRQRAMQGFRKGHYKVLVATDIASRGIDVEGVSHVVNYDIPNTPNAYTHRIGRTGRAEHLGKAYTFVTHEDFPAIKAIERKLQMHIPRIKLKEYPKTGPARPAGRPGAGPRKGGKGRFKAGSKRGASAGSRGPGGGKRGGPGAGKGGAGRRRS